MTFDRETVREINHRVASAATSIVMAHRKEPWPMELLRKKLDLRRINWPPQAVLPRNCTTMRQKRPNALQTLGAGY